MHPEDTEKHFKITLFILEELNLCKSISADRTNISRVEINSVQMNRSTMNESGGCGHKA